MVFRAGAAMVATERERGDRRLSGRSRCDAVLVSLLAGTATCQLFGFAAAAGWPESVGAQALADARGPRGRRRGPGARPVRRRPLWARGAARRSRRFRTRRLHRTAATGERVGTWSRGDAAEHAPGDLNRRFELRALPTGRGNRARRLLDGGTTWTARYARRSGADPSVARRDVTDPARSTACAPSREHASGRAGPLDAATPRGRPRLARLTGQRCSTRCRAGYVRRGRNGRGRVADAFASPASAARVSRGGPRRRFGVLPPEQTRAGVGRPGWQPAGAGVRAGAGAAVLQLPRSASRPVPAGLPVRDRRSAPGRLPADRRMADRGRPRPDPRLITCSWS